MGQYFKIVNEDKQEVVNPWKLGGGAKFFEWLYNNQARLLVWLLRKSDQTGGGDIDDPTKYKTLGRWAGDRVTLIGDYDTSRLWEQADTFEDISAPVREEYHAALKADGSTKTYSL